MCLVPLLVALLGADPGPPAALQDDPRSLRALVLLENAALPPGEEVVAAFRALAPGGETRGPIETGGDVSTFWLTLGRGGRFLVELVPAPASEREVEQALAFSASAALDPRPRLAPHHAHLVALLQDEPGRNRYWALVRFTYLLAAVARVSNATAVHWDAAGATHQAGWFVERAAEADPDVMIAIWTGYQVLADGPERVSVVTRGMRHQLGTRELLVSAPRPELAEAVRKLLRYAAFAARRGTSTFVTDPARPGVDLVRVHDQPSPLDPGQPVWRINYP